MYAVSFKFKDVENTATMSDDSEIKAVFHAGIAMGLQMLEISGIGEMVETLAPGSFEEMLNKMDKFVREAELSVKQV